MRERKWNEKYCSICQLRDQYSRIGFVAVERAEQLAPAIDVLLDEWLGHKVMQRLQLAVGGVGHCAQVAQFSSSHHSAVHQAVATGIE